MFMTERAVVGLVESGHAADGGMGPPAEGRGRWCPWRPPPRRSSTGGAEGPGQAQLRRGGRGMGAQRRHNTAKHLLMALRDGGFQGPVNQVGADLTTGSGLAALSQPLHMPSIGLCRGARGQPSLGVMGPYTGRTFAPILKKKSVDPSVL